MEMANLGGERGGFKFESGHAQVGLRLSTKNNDRVLQIQHASFTYSHLPPYTEWETFRKEFLSYWSTFLQMCMPEAVTRIALRYINRVVIPKPQIEIFDYFNLHPNLPKGVPQDVIGMFLQLQMPQIDIGPTSIAVINMGTDASAPTREGIAVMLDLDVSETVDYRPRSEDILSRLEVLRRRKNELFEASITDETRKLIS